MHVHCCDSLLAYIVTMATDIKVFMAHLPKKAVNKSQTNTTDQLGHTQVSFIIHIFNLNSTRYHTTVTRTKFDHLHTVKMGASVFPARVNKVPQGDLFKGYKFQEILVYSIENYDFHQYSNLQT